MLYFKCDFLFHSFFSFLLNFNYALNLLFSFHFENLMCQHFKLKTEKIPHTELKLCFDKRQNKTKTKQKFIRSFAQ